MKAEEISNLNLQEKIRMLKAKCDHEAAVLFCKGFLEMTGLKVGDTVKCRFVYHFGNSKNSYLTSGVKEGVIMEYPNGLLYVESKEELTDSYGCSNNRSGRSYRSWWQYRQVKMKSEITDIKFETIE